MRVKVIKKIKSNVSNDEKQGVCKKKVDVLVLCLELSVLEENAYIKND